MLCYLMLCYVCYVFVFTQRIKFTFSFMDIEDNAVCDYDGVSVSEDDVLIGKTCGSQGFDIVSWENSVTLRFYSDGSERRRGFVVDYTTSVYNLVAPALSKQFLHRLSNL